MSCLIVTDYHVNALITWAELHAVPLPFAAPVAAELLAAANRRAFAERYQDVWEAPAFGGYQVAALGELRPVDIVKACACLDYQARDWSGWERSDAWHVLRAVMTAAREQAGGGLTPPRLLRDMPDRMLPGYHGAAWTLGDSAEPVKNYGFRLDQPARVSGGAA